MSSSQVLNYVFHGKCLEMDIFFPLNVDSNDFEMISSERLSYIERINTKYKKILKFHKNHTQCNILLTCLFKIYWYKCLW